MIKKLNPKNISSFTHLNITQFLGALNDNIYKLLIVYFLISREGTSESSTILAMTGAVFVIPFLLFSAVSGTLADRYSKSTIIVGTKILEVVTMSLGLLGFILDWKIGSYLILFLMATQSALFSPSKYGIIPEIVPNEKISRANGVMSFFTYLAIILGTFIATFLTSITDRNFVLSAMLCVLVALIGLGTSFFIEYTQPSGSSKRVTVRFISEIKNTLKRVWYEAPAAGVLLTAIFSSAYFLFIGAFMQLNLIPYAVDVLKMNELQGGYLFLMTALGIGVGSFLSGKISGKTVELGLIPLAGFGLAFGFFALEFLDSYPRWIYLLSAVVGAAGGLYLVPLDSYIQVNSPPTLRGQVVAATNFFSFVGVLVASFAIYFINEVLGFPPDQGFVIVGWVTFVLAIVLAYQFFDFLTRFIGMILSKLHFKTTTFGEENIPDTPAIYVCTHTDWNDTLLLLGAQKRRMRFFVEEIQSHTPLLEKLYRSLRVIHIPAIEPLENNRECLLKIKEALRRGFSVCIFVSHEDVEATIERLKHSYSFQEILDELENPMIPVFIEKEPKEPTKISPLTKLLHKLHWPATLYFGRRPNGA